MLNTFFKSLQREERETLRYINSQKFVQHVVLHPDALPSKIDRLRCNVSRRIRNIVAHPLSRFLVHNTVAAGKEKKRNNTIVCVYVCLFYREMRF